MKIRSITDVITNSSTEVWAIRTPILEEAKSLFRDEAWREKAFWEGKENFYDSFVDFPDLQSILEAWKTPDGKGIIESFIPYNLYHLFYSYSLTPKETKLLKAFGHTPEELKDFEDKMNSDRISRIKEEDFKEYLGWSVAIFYDHFRMWGGHEAGKKLREWLTTNHNPEDWEYDY